jgi:hypothetical protein
VIPASPRRCAYTRLQLPGVVNDNDFNIGGTTVDLKGEVLEN